MPIFRSENPSSCVQCHLSSVDLKNYILPSHEKTFQSLRDQGLIDLENPDKSKILELIGMGHQDNDEYAKRIHEDMRKKEYEAFAAWIKSSAKDERLAKLPRLDASELAKPAHDNQIIRHARKSRVVNSFVRSVWSQRMRCFPCHTPHDIKPNQKQANIKFKQWFDQYGDQMLIFKETPRETIEYLIEQSKEANEDYLPLLDLENPEKSLFLLKPTAKIPPLTDGKRLPTYKAPVYHMGGLKMHTHDHSYKLITNWIKDYAKVTKGEYQTVEQLPADNWFPTQHVLRIKEIPESWPAGSVVQAFVYLNGEDQPGERKPLGFIQGTITPRRFVNGPVILLAPTEDAEFKKWRSRRNKIRPGDYVVKIYLDQNKRIVKDAEAILSKDEYQGKIEIPGAKWRAGFRNAQVISAADLKK